jgi:hypothetical protein
VLVRALSPRTTDQGIEAYVEALQQWSMLLLTTGRIAEGVRVTQELALVCERKGKGGGASV